MIKIKYLLLLILLIGLVKPLTANAGCCKKITWGPTYSLGIAHKGEAFNLNTEQECLDTCKFTLLKDCYNFFRKDATADVANNACVSATSGCCQVTWGANISLTGATYLAYPSDDQSECNMYCNLLTDCQSLFITGQVANTTTGHCKASPITANAGCCKKITWGITYSLGIAHKGEAFNLNTEQECLDTCKLTLLKDCYNFFRKGATADVANNACVSASSGCCQVTWGAHISITGATYLAYPSDDQTECNIYCNLLTDCQSVFITGQIANTSTGHCEVAKPVTDSGQPSVTDSGQPALNRSVYKTLPNPLGPTSWTIVDLPKVIGRVISALLTIIGAIALLIFVYGGFTWMTAAGNDTKVTQGKNILLWATIAIIIIFLSRLLVAFLFQALGV